MQPRRSKVLSESFNWLFPAAMGDKKSDPLQALINQKYLAHRPQTVVFDHQKDELEHGRFMHSVMYQKKVFPTFDTTIYSYLLMPGLQEIEISLWLFCPVLVCPQKVIEEFQFPIYFWNFWKNVLVFQHTMNLPWEIGRQILTQRPKTSHSKRHAPLEIFLAGPYGAPASGLFYRQVDHAVLIATGIGVTPFASILQSIMFKFGESRKRL